MGNKAGYADAILDALGLRSGSGADAYLWAEADPDVRALLRAYPDAAMLTRIAEIIRGWADEEPRALWERLRAERKARQGAEGTARFVQLAGANRLIPGAFAPDGRWVNSARDGGSHTEGGVSFGGDDFATDADANANAVTTLAAYATIAASNRLINVAGPDLMNTGAGGTTFGGEEFATPAGDVAAGFERVAGDLASFALQGQFAYRTGHPESGFAPCKTRPQEKSETNHGANPTSVASVADRIAPTASRSRWPPVAVLPSIPTAADVARWLGTPGDLSGCVVYADPPYAGTTGYGSNLTRDEVIAYARDFDALGAVVCISEAEPLTALGWEATAITGGRRGQKRTFSRQQDEYLTMNRPPAAVVATQMGMFGLAR